MSAYLSPVFGAGAQFFDNSGRVLSGGKIYTYIAGTTTPAATYIDSSQGVVNSNPIILDSSGRAPQEVWLAGSSSYKFVVTDSTGVQVGSTYDNISGVNDATYPTQTVSEWLTGSSPTYTGATTFTVAGDQTATYAVGRRVKCSVTAGLAYGTISNSSFGAGVTTVTVVNDSTTLDSGLSIVQYGIISPSPGSLPSTVLSSSTVQNQTVTSFTSTGTSTAFVLTPSPAISAYAAGQEFDVVFHTTSGATPTININALGAISLYKKKYDGSYELCGTGDVVANWRSKVVLLTASTALIRETIPAVTGTGSYVLATSPTLSALTLGTPLPVSSGGLGAATLTANYAMLGNGTSTPQLIAPGASGNILTSDGTTWGSALPPTGTLPTQTGNNGKFLTTDGSNASWATISATPAISALTAAGAANTIASGDYAQEWDWRLTTAAKTAFAIGETAASTGGSGAQYLLTVATAAASTANPFNVATRGVDTISVSRTGAVTITALNGTTGGGTTGSGITLTGGTGAASNNGGAITITGGTGGATSSLGGGITITSGAGVNGAGGAVTISSGGGTGSGQVQIYSSTPAAGSSGAVSVSSLASPAVTGNVTISVGNPSGSAVAGILTLTGGSSRAAQSGNSGGVVITGGAAGAVASIAGGPVVITGGAGSTTTTGGTGGAVTISGGTAVLAATGGAVSLVGGFAGAGTGVGGLAEVVGGYGNSTGGAGAAKLTGGAGWTGGNGGAAIITGGAAATSGNGGAVTITAGARAGTGAGASVSISATNGITTGAGGSVNITAGNGASAVGGDIVLTAGTGSTQGVINFVNLNVANGAVATTLTSVGPTGAATTVQGWLAVKVGGTARYIPFW